MSDALKVVKMSEIMKSEVALRTVDEESEGFLELCESVRSKGVLEPIQIRYLVNGKYCLINGIHRYTAAEKCGLTEIPCHILDVDEAKALEIQIVTNIMHVETPQASYAKHLKRMLAYSPTMTIGELAGKINKSTAWINQRFALLKLPEKIKEMVDSGELKLSNAFSLSKLPEAEMANYLDRALTVEPVEFAETVKTRVKELNEASRQGKEAKDEQYVPIAHVKKPNEIKEQLDKPSDLEVLIRDCKISDAKGGAVMALKWVLNLDPISITNAKAAYDARKAASDESKERRMKERAEKKAADAASKAAEAKEELEKVKSTVKTAVI